MFMRCQVCGEGKQTGEEMGTHLRKHGVNLFPTVLRLNKLVDTVVAANHALAKENEELKSRLRIVTL